MALEAARTLMADHQIPAGVLAVGQLHPLQLDDFWDARGHSIDFLVTVEESTAAWGFGSEVSASALQGLPGGVRPTFLRIGAVDTIVPASRGLEKEMLPDVSGIVSSVLGMQSATGQMRENIHLPNKADGDPETRPHNGGVELKALQLNANDDEIKIVEFMVADASEVELGQSVVAVETSKAATEIPSPAKGFVSFCCKIGDDVPVGQVIALIYPSRRELDAAHAVNQSGATSLGMKRDGTNQSVPESVSEKSQDQIAGADPSVKRIPFTKVQKAMQKTLQISHKAVVPAYLLAECRLHRPSKGKIDLLDEVIYQMARLVKDYPNCNAYYDGHESICRAEVHVGFTADIDGNLYIGVVRDAHTKTMEQIAADRMGLILSLFRGEIDQSMLAEPTICVTGLNGRWFRHQIPVVFPKTSLMVGFNQKIDEQKEIEASITFAYDHQILSGFEVSRFADGLITALVGKS